MTRPLKDVPLERLKEVLAERPTFLADNMPLVNYGDWGGAAIEWELKQREFEALPSEQLARMVIEANTAGRVLPRQGQVVQILRDRGDL